MIHHIIQNNPWRNKRKPVMSTCAALLTFVEEFGGASSNNNPPSMSITAMQTPKNSRNEMMCSRPNANVNTTVNIPELKPNGTRRIPIS